MEFLWAMAITAGMWTWVVKSRGEWNLILANLAGLGSGLIVYVVSAVVLEDVFDLENPKNLAYSIIALMTSLGALFGVWIWIASQPQPEHAVARHLLGALGGLLAGVVMMSIFALNE